MSDTAGAYYSACDGCRSRKFKCTKEKPTCVPCLRLGSVCKYSLAVKRTALTRSNLTAAEDRVRVLENAFARLLPGVDLATVLHSPKEDSSSTDLGGSPHLSKKDVLPDEGTDTSSPVAEPEALPLRADGFDWSEHAASLGDIADGMAALSINPEGAGYMGATSHVVSLRALMGNSQGVDQSVYNIQAWPSSFDFTSHISQSLALANLSEEFFINAYFRTYHQTYPFIHEPTFREQYHGSILRPHGHSWSILLNAVLALGAWCIGDDDSFMDDLFYQKAARLSAENSVFEFGNLAMVQALLLLSNYAQKRNRPNTGWNYLGLAVRMGMSLGLHKEFPDWEISLLQREIRRRVWWGLYIFDSGASITFGRPVLLPESGLMDASEVLNVHEESLTADSIALPAKIEEPTIYTSLISQSRFHAATNSIHHRLITTPEPSPRELLDLQKTINGWEEAIPGYFQFSSHHDSLLFARYRLSWRSWNLKIVLFRPIILRWAATRWRGNTSPAAETQDEIECRQNCLEAASSTITSVRDFTATNMGSRLSTWYMLYFLFQAGLIPIICLMVDPSNTQAGPWLTDIFTTKDLLTSVATSNRLAARCLEIFEKLCAPVFHISEPQDILGNPDLFDGSFNAYADEQFNGMDFWDWSNTMTQFPS